MEKPNHKADQKVGKVFLIFAGICVVVLPFIVLAALSYEPHKIEAADGTKPACLTCHARGGWTQELKRHTPLTPHPEQTYCRQCHVKTVTEKLFVASNWMSLPPPRLGRSHLPGSPPPIPHDLQMRGNCIACHVGPGAVTTIRVEHPSRGNCRPCFLSCRDCKYMPGKAEL